jgi:soluble lytic murein transglycosylase-like protein
MLVPAVSAARYSDGDSRSTMTHISKLRSNAGLSETTATTTVRSPRISKAAQAKAKYSRLIAKHAKANGVPVALAHAVVTVESRYNARARGGAGEVGLMQIKPSTARAIGYKGSVKALYDPETNLRWGMKYLGEAHKLGGGTTCGTILKYNAGHYAKRMNKISARYCGKVKQILGKS